MAQWNLRRQLEEAEAQRRLAAGLSATADDTVMERPIVLDAATTAAPTEGAWAANTLPPRRAASMTLPLWQGSSGSGPAAMVQEHAPPRATPPPARSAAADHTDELETDRYATRQPTKDRCPHCNGTVRLDRFDLVDAVAHMSCTDCGFQYRARSPKL